MFSASSCTHVRARREIESVRMSCARGVCGLACANGPFTIYCCSPIFDRRSCLLKYYVVEVYEFNG